MDVGTLTGTITFKTYGEPEPNQNSNFSIQVTSQIIPKPIDKPVLNPTYSYIYEPGVNRGTPYESGSYNTTAMTQTGTVNAVNAGNYTVYVDLKSDNYIWSTDSRETVSLTWSIARKTETLAGTSFDSLTGSPLSGIGLPTGWTWDNPSEVVKIGKNIYTASFTPSAADSGNYNTVENEAVEVVGTVLPPMAGYENLTWERGSAIPLQIKWDLEYDGFEIKSISLNGTQITSGFSFKPGSVILELDSAILANLPLGKNEITMELASGVLAGATFNVVEPTKADVGVDTNSSNLNSNVPETGDDVGVLGTIGLISVISVLGIGMIVIRRRLTE